MKTFLLIKALLLCAYVISAQDAPKRTVRIKKVENVNGVEKVWDTTYTTSDEATLVIDADLKTEDLSGEPGKKVRTMVVTSDCAGSKGEPFSYSFTDSSSKTEVFRILHDSKPLSEEEKKTLREAHETRKARIAEEKPGTLHEKVMIMEKPGSGAGNVRKIIMVRTVKLSDASPGETSKLSADKGTSLSLKEMNCYPNPANGKFNLSFYTEVSGDAQVDIFSSDGEKVLSETVKGQQGKYTKELDLSANPKGIYFVRISQGQESTVKKAGC